MTRREELERLAARVESLTGACRETDAAIFAALGTHVLEKRYRDKKAWWYPVGEKWSRRLDPHDKVPRFTASIDAAITLVPKGWRNWTSDSSVEGSTRWMLSGPRLQWATDESGERCAGNDWYQQGIATTPALALTAAALRAIAALGAS